MADRKRLLLIAGVTALALGQIYQLPLPGCADLAVAQVVTAQPASSASTETPASRDIAGQWQGTLQGKKSLRLVLMVAQADQGWNAKLYSIEQSGYPFPASSVTLNDSSFKCSIDGMGMGFQGTLSADGNSIAGTWTRASGPQPLTLVRAAGKAAWKIPTPPKPAKLMNEDADASFSKANIREAVSGVAGRHGFLLNGRNFTTYNTSVLDLISYAYEMQAKQVAGVPDWIANERYDIAATLEQKGVPTHQQLRVMMKKLLADRFRLSFHADKQELPAYVLTVAKEGQKLTPTQFQGPLPGMRLRPEADGVVVFVSNATMEDFAVFLQLEILDRPVVDLTGLTGRFDLQFTYTPDDSQFGGHPPKLPAATGPTEPAPGLARAMQQTVGLELSAEDVLVDMIVVDHVERPSIK
jgi:uncharacterized protein (TIGR03435 family)